MSGRAAGHAVIKSFGRTHDEVGRVVIVMERALAFPVLAPVFGKLDASRANEGEQVGFALHALNVFVWNSGHSCSKSRQIKNY